MKKCRGFTLIEIVTAGALTALVMTMAVTLFEFFLHMNAAASDSYSAQTTAELVMQRIRNDLQYADSVTILDSYPQGADGAEHVIYGGGGEVTGFSSGSVRFAFPQSTEKTNGFTCSAVFSNATGKTIRVKVNVIKKGKPLQSLETAIYLPNAELQGDGTGNAVRYALPGASVLVSSITVDCADGNIVLPGSGTLQMAATVLPANATNRAVTWSVQNQTGTAAIDPVTGLLTAYSNGTVIVRATAQDGSGIVSNDYSVIIRKQ